MYRNQRICCQSNSEKEMRVIFEDDKQSILYIYNKLIVKENKFNLTNYKLNSIPVYL